MLRIVSEGWLRSTALSYRFEEFDRSILELVSGSYVSQGRAGGWITEYAAGGIEHRRTKYDELKTGGVFRRGDDGPQQG